MTTEKPKVMVCYNGERPRGGSDTFDTHSRVDREWLVVVMRGHGFKSLVAESAGDVEPFYDSVETIRDIIRCMLNISDEEQIPSVSYRGIKPLPNLAREGAATHVFLDAYSIEFVTGNDIPAITLEAPGTDN